MSRFLVFRFDVDTELCLREGAPRLVDLAERLGVRFTFFVNPGRAIRRRDLFRRRGSRRTASAPKLSILNKLGLQEAFRLFCLNPRIAPNHASMLRDLRAAGHDIGLHGGRNHGAWARGAHCWSVDRLASEVDFGIRQFESAGLGRPNMFASPGWSSPPDLPRVLAARGIRVMADSHGPRKPDDGQASGLASAHTSLCGEPGGVGYLEFMRARGAGDREIVEDFQRRLEGESGYACMYDHPFYAGRRELGLLENLIEVARGREWEVAPLSRALAVADTASSQ